VLQHRARGNRMKARTGGCEDARSRSNPRCGRCGGYEQSETGDGDGGKQTSAHVNTSPLREAAGLEPIAAHRFRPAFRAAVHPGLDREAGLPEEQNNAERALRSLSHACLSYERLRL